jgi:hypothetical protein
VRWAGYSALTGEIIYAYKILVSISERKAPGRLYTDERLTIT